MYLRLKDYDRFIQQDNLNQIISQDSSIRLLAESVAIEEASSYLRSKYDVSAEFTDTMQYQSSAQYTFGDRVELRDYAQYNESTNYAINDIVALDTTVYVCIDATTGVFDELAWNSIGQLNDLYYVTSPVALFDYRNGIYKVGDEVAYKGKIYTALKPSPSYGHVDLLNALRYSNLPPTNILPDDPNLGILYWGEGVSWYITTPPDEGGQWVKGDNRSQQMVMVLIDIVLYHIHSRIAPRNIPDLRVVRYQSAIEWLKLANVGNITPDLPLLTVTLYSRIVWGSNTKTTNIY